VKNIFQDGSDRGLLDSRAGKWIWICLCLGLAIAAIEFRWSAVQEINWRTPDEQTYATYANEVVKAGPAAIPKLVKSFIGTKDLWVYPPPTRVGYIYLVAGIAKLTDAGVERSAIFLSFVCSALTFLFAVALGWRFFNRWMVLPGLAFLAVSPVELALAGRGWQDAVVGAWGTLLLWLTLERSTRADGRWWDLSFWLVGFLFLLIKESALAIFGICVLLLLLGQWQQRRLSWKNFFKIAVASSLTVLLSYSFVFLSAGGPQNVFQLYRCMAGALRTNVYVYLYQAGPWYAIPLGFWVLSPVSVFLFLTGAGLIFLRPKRFAQWLRLDARQTSAAFALACFAIAVVAAVTIPEGFKCLRYVSVADVPLCLIGGLVFAGAVQKGATQFQPPRWWAATTLGSVALLIVSFMDLSRFRQVFITDRLGDLAVVRLINFVVTNRDMAFAFSRPFWEFEEAPVTDTHSSKAERYLRLSYKLYKEGSYSKSIDAAKNALREKPDYADAWNNIGAAYNEMGRHSDAAEAFRQALRLRPDFGLAQRNLEFTERLMKKASPPP
jgi:4-amino-4-deoxy-L-arabinose transferase-like glycosyltransferase